MADTVWKASPLFKSIIETAQLFSSASKKTIVKIETRRKKWNIFLDLGQDDGGNGEGEDDGELEEGDGEGVDVRQPLDDYVGEGKEGGRCTGCQQS